jgi:hypothetical protein
VTIETTDRPGSGLRQPDWRPLDACPACGATELHPVYDGELMNFFCPLCISCWHVELGFVHRIRPETCPGCQYQLICTEHQQAPPR